MKLQLSKQVVEIKDELTWYESEELQSILMDGLKLDNSGMKGISGEDYLRGKIKTFEKLIISIKEGEKVIPFSVDWVKKLNQADGELLSEEIAKVYKKK